MISSQPNNFFYIILPTYLTALIPFLLITGPFLPDLAVSLCAIIFLINAYKNSLIKYFKNIFFISFFLFYILLIISSLNSNEVLISLNTSVFYIRFCIFWGFWYFGVDMFKFGILYFCSLGSCYSGCWYLGCWYLGCLYLKFWYFKLWYLGFGYGWTWVYCFRI